MPSVPLNKHPGTETKGIIASVVLRPSFNAALKAEAAKKGMSFSAYAATLLEVAWAARHGQSGDFELDRTVAGTLLLAGSGLDLDAIGATLGVSEDLVDKIVGAFKQEVGHA